MIEVREYQKPEEKTYITPDIFFAVNKESQIGLRVIDGNAEFLGYEPMTGEYNRKGLYLSRSNDISVFEALLDAYKNRGK